MGDDAEYYMELQAEEAAFERQQYAIRYSCDLEDEYYEADDPNTVQKNKNLVVLIDAENVSYKYAEQIYQEILEMGEIFEARYYAMQKDLHTKAWNDIAKEYGIKKILLYGEAKKNKVDEKIIKDAKSILQKHKNVDIFCIVSRDGDYAELVMLLRNFGKRVVVLGPEGISQKLIDEANKTIQIE
jgi:uncharacterized LabA/DUF88 family protein